MKKKFTNVFWQEGKYFVGLCLELDISSFGETAEESEKMLKEAIELSLEDILVDDYRFSAINNPRIIESEYNLSYA